MRQKKGGGGGVKAKGLKESLVLHQSARAILTVTWNPGVLLGSVLRSDQTIFELSGKNI